MDITLSVAKSAVMNEVAKQTSYIGMKITTADGSNAYDQVFTTNDDYSMLEKYWRESVNATTGNLRKFIKTVSDTPPTSSVDNTEVFSMVLNMPNRYDNSQTGTIQSSLFNYFVNSITAKWLGVAYKTDAEYYDKYASTNMIEILNKIFYKKPVQRTTI
ncbi:MAG: hypothetical protein WCR45_07785 [Bacteroidaceae bacterium]